MECCGWGKTFLVVRGYRNSARLRQGVLCPRYTIDSHMIAMQWQHTESSNQPHARTFPTLCSMLRRLHTLLPAPSTTLPRCPLACHHHRRSLLFSCVLAPTSLFTVHGTTMPAPSSLQLCCSVAELQRNPTAAIDILQQFQSEGADDDWIHIVATDNHSLVHALIQQLNALIATATPPPHTTTTGTNLPASLVVSDLDLYSALVNLLFIFASLSSQTVCPILLQYDIVNIPLIASSTNESCDAAVVPLILLRLQLLALTISSYPASISPPPPHPLILSQTLSLLTHANDDIQLAASACLFLLLSISQLTHSMPALLSHPNLPAFLTAIQSLLTTAPSTGYSSPFLPLSLTVLSEMAACLSLLQQNSEPLPVSETTLLEVWDSVCELLEEESGSGEGMDADVRSSTLDCLFSLLSIPSMQREEMLNQYSTYKRKYRNAVPSQADGEEQQQSTEPPKVTTAEKADRINSSSSSSKRHSLNPFDDDDGPSTTADTSAASTQPASSSTSLDGSMPFSAADCDTILNAASASSALSTTTLINKIDQLSSLLDGPATQQEWLTYLEASQYRLLLVLAYLYTQGNLPPASCDAILSILLSLSSLSATCQGVTSAVLSHPSLLAVLLSQLTETGKGWNSLVRLQVLYFVYSSQSSPTLDTTSAHTGSASLSSDGIVDQLVPLLSSDDERVVALTVYVILLSHQPNTAIPTELLSLTASYSFQLELLQLLNRGALTAAIPTTISPPSSTASGDSSDRSDVVVLLCVGLLFCIDLLSSESGVQWVYTNDLYVLVDVLLQRIEDQQAVSEADVESDGASVGGGGGGESDVVVLCERVLLALLEHWQGWRVKGGYKRRQMQQLMEQVERERGADADTVKVKEVYRHRTALASGLLSKLSSIAESSET